MTTSQKTHFLSEVVQLDAKIPVGKLEFLRERLRNNLYAHVLNKFLERQKRDGLTQAALAERIDCDPGRLSKLLGAPGNWTIGTVSDLLAGISGEELVPQSAPLLSGTPRNYRGFFATNQDIPRVDVDHVRSATGSTKQLLRKEDQPHEAGSINRKVVEINARGTENAA